MHNSIPCPHKESTVQCPPCRKLYKAEWKRKDRWKKHKQRIAQDPKTFVCTHPHRPSKGDGPTKYCWPCRRLVDKMQDRAYRLRKEAKRRKALLEKLKS